MAVIALIKDLVIQSQLSIGIFIIRGQAIASGGMILLLSMWDPCILRLLHNHFFFLNYQSCDAYVPTWSNNMWEDLDLRLASRKSPLATDL